MSEQQSKPDYQYGLSEITVQIPAPDGVTRTVPGLTHKSSPGLAVTMLPFGVFQVTHINTGSKLCNNYERAASALLAMSQWALIADIRGASWADFGRTGAADLISEVSSEEVPFDGCTSTSQGETRKMTVSEWFQCQRIPIFDEFPWEQTDPFELAISNLEKIELEALTESCCVASVRPEQDVLTTIPHYPQPHPEGDGCGERLPNPCPYCGKMPQSNGSPNWRVECSNLNCSVQKPESPQPPVEQEAKGDGRS